MKRLKDAQCMGNILLFQSVIITSEFYTFQTQVQSSLLAWAQKVPYLIKNMWLSFEWGSSAWYSHVSRAEGTENDCQGTIEPTQQ